MNLTVSLLLALKSCCGIFRDVVASNAFFYIFPMVMGRAFSYCSSTNLSSVASTSPACAHKVFFMLNLLPLTILIFVCWVSHILYHDTEFLYHSTIVGFLCMFNFHSIKTSVVTVIHQFWYFRCHSTSPLDTITHDFYTKLRTISDFSNVTWSELSAYQ